MRIVFMGTPDFAVGALEAIIAAGHEITAVVTQPDKAKGRGKGMQYPAVKEAALAHHIPIVQPVKIKNREAVEQLSHYEADLFVVAAFGQILSKEILEMPRLGCINIHASLLPKYRGAAPIQWAILNGETETGITIMQMNEGLDTGDMLWKKVVPISKKETGESLHDKLKEAGGELIVMALEQMEQGMIHPQKQKEEDSCYAKMLSKALGHIEWGKSAEEIERFVRGLNSWPSAYTYFKEKTLKIWEADVLEGDGGEPGTIAEISKEYFTVYTGNGLLKIKELQIEGKRRMSVKEFLLGTAIAPNMKLGKATDNA